MPYRLKRIEDLSIIRPYLEQPYNKPRIENRNDEEVFYREYEKYDELVRSTLSQFGGVSAFSGTKFSMGDPWGDSRKIGIVLNVDDVCTEAVLSHLWNTMHNMPLSYLLVLSGDVIANDFYILIDKDEEIVGYSPDPKVLDAFGFPP